MKSIIGITVAAAFLALGPPATRAAEQTDQDVGMFLQNFKSPFVTQHFAERLGQLVVSEKYQGALIPAKEPPEVQDKGDLWWVTIKVQRWLVPPIADTPLAPPQLTVWIRKRDAAIVSIR